MSASAVRRFRRACVTTGFIVAVLVPLAVPGLALAATFSGALPAAGATVTTSPAAVSVAVADTVPLLGTPVLTVDGVPRAATVAYAMTPKYWDDENDWWVPAVYDYTRATVSCAPGVVPDGPHAVSVSLAAGTAPRTYAWDFGVSAKPVLGAVTPASGTTTAAAAPSITVKAADNSGITAYSATLDGASVPAALDASGTLRVNPATIANNASHTVAVIVADAAGNVASKSWTFTVNAPVTTWSAESPTPGSVATSAPRGLSTDGRCTSALNQSSARVLFDGVSAPALWLSPYPNDAKRATIVTYPAAMSKDGSHTVSVTVANTGGNSSTHTWSFSTRVAPTIGTPSPAAGSSVSTTTPVILVLASDNTAISFVSATVNGAPVPASYDLGTGMVRVTPVSALPDDALSTVTVSVFDSIGLRCDSTWSFEVETRPVMAGTANACEDCHPGIGSDPDMSPRCEMCHVEHVGTPSSYHAAADVTACRPCHVSSLLVEHAGRTTKVGAAIACATCHGSTKADVKAAIAAGDSGCASCHAGLGAGHFAVHDTTTAGTALAGTTEVCGDCHDANLMTEHAKASASSSAAGCDACHPSARSTITTFDPATCVQGGCHTPDSTKPMHASINAAHAIPADKASCLVSGCHDASGMVPLLGKSVAELHANATTTTAGTTLTSCRICHGNGRTPTTDCTTVGCHADRAQPHGYGAGKHTASPPSNITVLGVTYSLACSTCHTTLELGPIHLAPAGSATCSSCHATLVSALSAPPATGWDKGCVQAGCHVSGGTNPMHPTIDADHTRVAGGADDACFASGCHTGGNSLAAIHAPKEGCATCHGSGKTPTKTCATAGCHDLGSPHGDVNGTHASSGGTGYISIHPPDEGVDAGCSGCHITGLLALHANSCATCHASSARDAAKIAVANHNTSCTTCHLGQHSDNSHDGDYDCGGCHSSRGCDCHSAVTPVWAPNTTSDAKSSYIGDATIRLIATDKPSDPLGIRATYYSLDGAVAVTGVQIIVPAPASGTQSHTLTFWSTDWSGNVETAHGIVFNVVADTFAPVTSSTVISGKAYAGNQTFALTVVDDSSASAWWQLDGTASSSWTAGTSVPVAAPPSGTAAHTLYWYSRDSVGNTEILKSVNFSVAAGRDFSFTRTAQTFVVPSGVTAVDVTLNGASGGSSFNYLTWLHAGGLGGRVSVHIPVTPGATLTVKVGGAGSIPYTRYYAGSAGWPSGGSGYTASGGGGGSSSIWLGATELAEAGAGGGGGTVSNGTAGGSQGTGSVGGGIGLSGSTAYTGGGGGGGWNGGLAGTNSSGGAGGTSYISVGTGTLTPGANSGNGSAMIRY